MTPTTEPKPILALDDAGHIQAAKRVAAYRKGRTLTSSFDEDVESFLRSRTKGAPPKWPS
jgi:hypothetical protein